MFKSYYYLTKPGIIRGNLIPAIAGFSLASRQTFHVILLFETLIGISLVIACGCVLNNIIDRDIDSKMSRTKNRAIVTGKIEIEDAIIYAFCLGLIGLVTLGIFTNILTVSVGVLGLLFYVVIYGIAKRRTVYGTLVGSISGALPPVAGYLAVSNKIDSAALILFLILVFWQMPHFYAIGIYRIKDYKKAGLPILPIVRGIVRTKLHILGYIIAYAAATIALYLYGYTKLWYLIVAIILSGVWFYIGLQGYRNADVNHWARNMFRFSLIVLSIECLAITLSGILA